MTRKKKWIGAILLVLIAGIAFFLLSPTTAHARGLLDDTISSKNEYSRFSLMNYQLDYYVDSSWDWLPWNWSRGLGNQISEALFAITNMFWILSLLISSATGYIVQEAFNLDFVGQTAEKIGKNIQTIAGVDRNGISLTSGFYGGFLLLLILILGIYVAYTGLIKREATKAIRACLNFIIVLILSTSFIAFAPDYIRNINDFSRDMSNEALKIGTQLVLPNSSIQGEDSTSLIRDSLFGVQVVEPWKLLQYGSTDISDERVDELRSATPYSSEREDVVIDEISNQDNLNLTITSTMARLGIVFFLLLFNIAISIFVFLLTAMMIASQIIFIVYSMFLPISFLLSMIPTFENMSKKALMNVFNTLMVRAGLTLIITIAFSISTMLYSLSSDTAFFFIMFLQIVTFGGIYGSLGKIMGMFSLQSGDSQSLSKQVTRNVQRVMGRANRKMNPMRRGGPGGIHGNRKPPLRENPGVVAKNSSTKSDQERVNVNGENVQEKGSMGQRVGKNIGKVVDTKDSVLDKGRELKDDVKNLPTNAQYAIHKGKRELGENVSDLKNSITETKENAQQERLNKRNNKRELVAQRHLELENRNNPENKEVSKGKQASSSVQKGKESSKERRTNQSTNENGKTQSRDELPKENHRQNVKSKNSTPQRENQGGTNSNKVFAETNKKIEALKDSQISASNQSPKREVTKETPKGNQPQRTNSSSNKRPNQSNQNSIDHYIESYENGGFSQKRQVTSKRESKNKKRQEEPSEKHLNKGNNLMSTEKRR